MLERIVSNTCDAIRDFNACQTFAIIERPLSNTCDAIWDLNACQACAQIERPSPILVTLFGISMLFKLLQ